MLLAPRLRAGRARGLRRQRGSAISARRLHCARCSRSPGACNSLRQAAARLHRLCKLLPQVAGTAATGWRTVWHSSHAPPRTSQSVTWAQRLQPLKRRRVCTEQRCFFPTRLAQQGCGDAASGSWQCGGWVAGWRRCGERWACWCLGVCTVFARWPLLWRNLDIYRRYLPIESGLVP